MSLKAFHVFFIVISTLLAFGVGVWSFTSSVVEGSYAFMGILSFAVGIGLIFYAKWFLSKHHNTGSL